MYFHVSINEDLINKICLLFQQLYGIMLIKYSSKMKIAHSDVVKEETPTEIYRRTLTRHKELIKNNKYAQELEKKYNRFRYKFQQQIIWTDRIKNVPKQ